MQPQLFVPDSAWRPPTEMPRLAGLPRIGLDVETYDPTLKTLGPSVRRGGYIVGISVSTGERSWYLPFRHADGENNLPADTVLRWARDELNNFDGEIVGANLSYDLDYLAHEGITFPRVKWFRDVQVAAPLLDENRYTYSLDALAAELLGTRKDESLLREAAISYGYNPKSDLWKLPARYVGAYAEEDARLPLELLDKQMPLLEADGLSDLFDLESKLLPVLLGMRRRGVKLDLDRVDRARATLEGLRAQHLAEATRIGGRGIELNASASFAPILEKRGFTLPRTQKTGKPSITKGWLEDHASDPFVASILAARKYDHALNNFVMSYVNGHLVNGRLHTTFNQLRGEEKGTIARLSSSDPNLQNIPARDPEMMPLIRGMFVPEDGETWECLDWSQIEYRLLAHYAVGTGAEEARQMYRDDPNTDFHNMCAGFLCEDPADKFVRKKVKAVNFAKGYGAQAARIAGTARISLKEAEDFIALYERKLPWTVQTFKRAAARAVERGYVTTIMGRRGRFDLWEPSGARGKGGQRPKPLPRERALEEHGPNIQRAMTYKGLNRVIQGGAADLMKKAMVDIDASGAAAALGPALLTVHDELDYSRPRTREGEDAIMHVKRIMETCLELRVPIIADRESGPSWGELK